MDIALCAAAEATDKNKEATFLPLDLSTERQGDDITISLFQPSVVLMNVCNEMRLSSFHLNNGRETPRE
jgi:hypothetical protein